jgi:ubiquinone/menaquinone biosynthesis C-methylase UbiE
MEATLTVQNTKGNQAKLSTKENVIDYYTDAGPDYEFWSKNFNMHFGYAKLKGDCLSRETMLQRMNEIVLDDFNIQPKDKIVDIGCGLGATLRFGAKAYPFTRFTGFTITPWQIQQSNKFIKALNLDNAKVKYGDYADIPLRKNSVDGVYGIESICHAKGFDKKAPLQESFRVLKQGGRFTMVDGFLKKPENELSPFVFRLYKRVCVNWALPCFPEVKAIDERLKKIGFTNIIVEEISYKIAPSAVHAPFTTLAFLIKKMFKGEQLNQQSWNNLKACFSIFFLGLSRSSIGYFKINATKP